MTHFTSTAVLLRSQLPTIKRGGIPFGTKVDHSSTLSKEEAHDMSQRIADTFEKYREVDQTAQDSQPEIGKVELQEVYHYNSGRGLRFKEAVDLSRPGKLTFVQTQEKFGSGLPYDAVSVMDLSSRQGIVTQVLYGITPTGLLSGEFIRIDTTEKTPSTYVSFTSDSSS